MDKVLFTPDRMASLPEIASHSSSLITRLARWPGPQGIALRAQLERVASAVPTMARPRVLGPLMSNSASDGQVRDALHALLLARTLSDLGWEVHFEPKFEKNLTPDLLIRRGESQYVVEVRRVLGEMHGWDKSARLIDAVAGVATRHPMEILDAAIDGAASLKGFRRFVEKLRGQPLPTGKQIFKDQGVSVVFRVYETSFDVPAILGATSQGICCDVRPAIRAAITEKLKRYPMPLVVALDLVDVLNPFDGVREAICTGEEHLVIPINMTTGEPAGPSRVEFKQSALVHGRASNAVRARERLIGVLAFECGFGSEPRYEVAAQWIANPTAPAQTFEAFAPIPRFVVVDQTSAHRTMAYLGADNLPGPTAQLNWRHIP